MRVAAGRLDQSRGSARTARRVAVCVPVRNEEALLPSLLAALETQLLPARAEVTLCFYLDGCRDDSERLLREHSKRSRWMVRTASGYENAPPNAGRARARAIELGLELVGGEFGTLLTTDADSVPASDWLREMQTALGLADVVAGRVARLEQRPSPAQDRVENYYDRLFAFRRSLDPVDWECERPHHYTGGANLGMRAAAYNAVGGFQPRASGEDAQFVDDAARAGLRVRRHSASLVYTSDRRRGRAIGGLADVLGSLDRDDLSESVVAHPVDAAWQYSGHAAARRAFASGEIHSLASRLGLTVDHVAGVARECPNSEAFAMRVVPEPPGGMRHVSFVTAEAILDQLLSQESICSDARGLSFASA